MRIQVDREILREIAKQAEEGYPHEICGALYGTRDQDGTVVKAREQIINQREGKKKKRRFSIDPVDYMKAEQEAERRDMELLGFYHSHPDHPAEPSDYDREHAWPNLLYPIVSVQDGEPKEIRWWILEKEQNMFRELDVRIE